MSESKHTPGPWLVVRPPSGDRRKPVEVRAWNTNPNAIQGRLICKISQPDANRLEAFDNAALIAVAPELLAVCQDVLSWPGSGDDKLLDRMRSVVAKANDWESSLAGPGRG